MAWTTSERVMRLRGTSRLIDVAVETLDGFRRHLSGRNAAVLAYYGFFTLFPLLMAATTVLGFVLEDNPDLQRDIVDSALAQIPIIGDQIRANAGQISGNWWALVIGLAVATWSSLRAFVGLQSAFDDCWEVPVDDRANAIVTRVRALVGVTVIGGAQIAAVVLAAVVSESGLPRTGQVLVTLGGLAINIAVVATMYRFLTSRRVAWSMVWPGAVLSGVVYTILQFAGTALMTRTFADAEAVYGAFAGTLALLTWLSVHALVSLLGADLNAALERLRTGRHAAPAPSALDV